MKNLKLIMAGVVALFLSQTAFAVSGVGDGAVAARSAEPNYAEAHAIAKIIQQQTGYAASVQEIKQLHNPPALTVSVMLPIDEIERNDGNLTDNGKSTFEKLQAVANTRSGMAVYLPRSMVKGETIGDNKEVVAFMSNIHDAAPDSSVSFASDSGSGTNVAVHIYMDGPYQRTTLLPSSN